ncbi:MAG: hypothetical protein KME04_09515 [Pleurocapsa minor GSE-CHR-MK-17-07R]|jgi:hypothetical protein|nr:hypothetical protein [Pleurocapsa minor GSE-CHR-MK 17-07R]
MNRRITAILLTCCALVPSLALAQMTPTPDPAVSVPAAEPTFDPLALTQRQLEALPILINVRADIEIAADAYFGVGSTRPEGWVSNLDINDPQLAVLLRLNLEILAGLIYGPDVRPDGWFGAIFSTPNGIARDLRHDLELVADRVSGAPTIRPAGWLGDSPVMRCDRETQALVTLLERSGYVVGMDFMSADPCAGLALDAALYAEQTLIQPDLSSGSAAAANGDSPVVSSGGGTILPFRTDSPFVVAFLDRDARRRVGVLPIGEGFRPLNRSETEFSNMMLIGGDGFELYVDYTTTPLTTFEYFSLQPAGEAGGTYCQAAWCD